MRDRTVFYLVGLNLLSVFLLWVGWEFVFEDVIWPRFSPYVSPVPGLDGDALRQIPAACALDESKTPPIIHTQSPYCQADPRGGHA